MNEKLYCLLDITTRCTDISKLNLIEIANILLKLWRIWFSWIQLIKHSRKMSQLIVNSKSSTVLVVFVFVSEQQLAFARHRAKIERAKKKVSLTYLIAAIMFVAVVLLFHFFYANSFTCNTNFGFIFRAAYTTKHTIHFNKQFLLTFFLKIFYFVFSFHFNRCVWKIRSLSLSRNLVYWIGFLVWHVFACYRFIVHRKLAFVHTINVSVVIFDYTKSHLNWTWAQYHSIIITFVKINDEKKATKMIEINSNRTKRNE